MKKTITAALAVAVIGTSAMFAATAPSQAGYYGGYYGGFQPFYSYCYWTKVQVWTYHGFHWKKIKVCH